MQFLKKKNMIKHIIDCERIIRTLYNFSIFTSATFRQKFHHPLQATKIQLTIKNRKLYNIKIYIKYIILYSRQTTTMKNAHFSSDC